MNRISTAATALYKSHQGRPQSFSSTMNNSHRKTLVGRIITYSSIGIQIGFAIAIGVIAGVYLDQWLHTGPWLTLLGLLTGLVSGFTRLYQIGKEFEDIHRGER